MPRGRLLIYRSRHDTAVSVTVLFPIRSSCSFSLGKHPLEDELQCPEDHDAMLKLTVIIKKFSLECIRSGL